MGNKKELKLLILSLVFLGSCIIVYGFQQSEKELQRSLLKDYFRTIPGYNLVRTIPLTDDALNMLHLDDYLFADYEGPNGKVNLYIGYYYTSDKAYAAHSPLICYPSQGWKIDSGPTKGSLQVGSYTINYKEIITTRGEQKELVLFWFQARTKTNTQIYKNKINMGFNKLVHNDPQHSFVRIAVPIKDSEPFNAKRTAQEFIQVFTGSYGQFVTGQPKTKL